MLSIPSLEKELLREPVMGAQSLSRRARFLAVVSLLVLVTVELLVEEEETVVFLVFVILA